MDIVKKAGCQRDWEIDSAAIENWHAGSRPNSRAVAIMDKYYLAYDNRARQITTQDFYTFDYILAMDDYNVEDLNEIKPNDATARIFLLGDFDPNPNGERIIRDPYCVSSMHYGRWCGKIFENNVFHLFHIGHQFGWL